MAWDLNGSNQYAQFTMSAALQAATGGPMTMAALVHLDATTDGAFICTMSGSTVFQFIEIFGTYNYGTTAGARTGPAGTTGAWYYVILSKDTGNIAPEYTLIPLATMVPVSGTITGGGVTLGNGTAPGAAGFIQVGRWGTSATELVDGRVAAAAIWTAYKNQAAREALTTWALTLASSGLQWAVHLDTLSTITDASGHGGGETGRFGTTPFTLSADPSGPFFGAGDVAIADSSAGGSTSGTADGLAIGDGGGGGSTGGTTDGLAVGSGSGGGSTGGAADGLAIGDLSAGGGTAGGGDGLALGSSAGGGGSGGSGDSLAIGDGSGGSGTGGAGTGLQLGDSGTGGSSGGSGDGLTLGDGSGGGSTGGQTDPVAVGGAPVAIQDTSGGNSTGGQADTISGVPVTIGDTSGGGSTGGTPDPVTTQGVVHDVMVMPIAINAHGCLLTEVGKLASPPSSVQIRPGAVFTAMADNVGDECCSGIAWVRLGQQVPTSARWPQQLDDVEPPARGVPSFYAVQIELGILRCIPLQSDVEGAEGQYPTAAQWMASAVEFADDAAALRRTICCLQGIYGSDSVLAGVITPLQNEGICGGQTVVIQVRAPYCDCQEAG